MVLLVRDILSKFMKPDAIPLDVKGLLKLDLQNRDLHYPDKFLAVGKFSYFALNKARLKKKSWDQHIRAAFSTLAKFLPNAITSEEVGQLDEEVRVYQIYLDLGVEAKEDPLLQATPFPPPLLQNPNLQDSPLPPTPPPPHKPNLQENADLQVHTQKTPLPLSSPPHKPNLQEKAVLQKNPLLPPRYLEKQQATLHPQEKFSAMGNRLSALKEHGYSLVSEGKNKILVKNKDGDQFVIKKLSANQDNSKFLLNLNHPHIVQHKECIEDSDCLYLVLEHCEGGDLAQKIKNKKEKNATFSESEILDWIVKICMALKYLHDQQILHKNMQPKVQIKLG
ncbi:hypothetical protein QQF64_023959 [Cirrhinus molitorella]|uniref:non-specific serine/threonine protein kinase n=1 Tax=Cirrhinus molitorella TaxID=172907 RepID=A0ABR3NJV6_9TELE